MMIREGVGASRALNDVFMKRTRDRKKVLLPCERELTKNKATYAPSDAHETNCVRIADCSPRRLSAWPAGPHARLVTFQFNGVAIAKQHLDPPPVVLGRGSNQRGRRVRHAQLRSYPVRPLPLTGRLLTWPAEQASKSRALGGRHVKPDARLAQLEPWQARLALFLVGPRSRPFVSDGFFVEQCTGSSEPASGHARLAALLLGLRSSPFVLAGFVVDPRVQLEEKAT